MFGGFFEFVKVGNDAKVQNADDFLRLYEGQSFLHGLYRIFNAIDVEKWTEIVKKAFPEYDEQIRVFGFDWLGRIFAMDLKNNAVLLYEPGTGEVIDIPADFHDFHNELIPEYPQDCLAFDFFNEWFEANNHCVLLHNQCAGYRIPLFLNGKDEIENLEISDMEVYWGIMSPLMT